MATFLRMPALYLVVLAACLFARSAAAQSELGPPGAAPPAIDGGSPSAPSSASDNRYHVLLTDGSHLIGTLELGKEIAFGSTVGEVSLPVEKIAELRFVDRPGCCIAFHNGDRLSGSLALMTIKLKTIWGVAEIELEHIDSIISERQIQKNATGPNGYGEPAATPYAASGYYGAEPAPMYAPPPASYSSPMELPPLPEPAASPR